MNNTIKFNLLSVDALHDGESWSWNNWYSLKEYEIADNISDKDLLKTLIDDGYLNGHAILDKTINIYDDGYNIELQDINNDYMPIYALCYGEYE